MNIKIKDLVKVYGDGYKALKGLNLEIEPGMFGLLGPNGAGKSTLVKILSGAHKKDSGTIIVGGKEVEIETPVDSKMCGIRCIYQELSLAPDLSVANNIFLGQERMKGKLVDQKTINQEAPV